VGVSRRQGVKAKFHRAVLAGSRPAAPGTVLLRWEGPAESINPSLDARFL
jgi:hypothetical protein